MIRDSRKTCLERLNWFFSMFFTCSDFSFQTINVLLAFEFPRCLQKSVSLHMVRSSQSFTLAKRKEVVSVHCTIQEVLLIAKVFVW